MSYLQHLKNLFQPSHSSSRNMDSSCLSSQGGPLLDSIQKSNKSSDNNGSIQRTDDSHKRRLTEEQYLKRKQVTTTAPYLKSPLVPQVVRRKNYLTLAKTASSSQASSAATKQVHQSPQTRHGSTVPSTPPVNPTPHPRWHNQSCMLFLALREHPEHAMPRTDLINAALQLDNKISTERDFPLAFRGKTPKNSASALLTNNNGRHFQSYRPSGSRSMHFRLTFTPADFTKAVEMYEKWMETLIKHDWPLCFGKPRMNVPSKKEEEEVISTQQQQQQHPTEFDAFLANRKKDRALRRRLNDKENHTPSPPVHQLHQLDKGICESIQWQICGNKDDDTTPPSCLQDIIYAKYEENNKVPISIHAQRRLPANTPLGFYFGTPTTEDEFELFKQDQRNAVKYCVMYDRTVLDATDDQGQLFLDPLTKHYCPYHFMRQAPTPSLANVLLLKGKIYNQVICWSKRSIDIHEELMVWIECEK